MAKHALFFIPLIALALSACETDHPYRGMEPPERMQPGVPVPSPAPEKPVASAGALKPQNIAIYMDALERDLRVRLRGSSYLVARKGDEIFIGAQNSQLFDGAGALTEAASAWLDRMALSLRRYDRTRLEVAGFTDTTGANDKNIELSSRRAQKIGDALVSAGVKSARIKTIGYGETRLKVETGDEVSEPRNRRIEIRLTAQPG